jgi:OOP family OmpA-OmpF porin
VKKIVRIKSEGRTSARTQRPLSGVFGALFLAELCFVGLSLSSRPAAAQLVPPPPVATEPLLLEGSINVQRFNPAPGPRNFITTRGARTDGEHAFSVGLLGSFAKDPFVVGTQAAGDTHVVQALVTGDLLVSYTPVPIFQLGLRLPITYAKGNGINPLDGSSGTLQEPRNDIAATGLSDPELEAKFRIVGEVKDPFVLGAALFLGAPLGEASAEGAYIGSESVTAGGRIIGDVAVGPAVFGVNLGYRYKDEGRIGETEYGSEGFYGVAAGVAIGSTVHLVADLFGSSQFSSDVSTNAAEVDGALKIAPEAASWAITAGGGAGLAAGSVGVPSFRALLGFSYTNEASDSDSDGLAETDDQCPTEPEDTDGFEDSDGCPDLDNDGDALEDSTDKCANDAEDLDKYQDSDGCPDPDNDKDGVRDEGDRCADEAETKNGFEDEDGCPDVPDKDGDGVADDKDKCAEQAEDTDGFEDVDGCPDPDNDGDGVPDDRDECVDDAEDGKGKGAAAEDGCPQD